MSRPTGTPTRHGHRRQLAGRTTPVTSLAGVLTLAPPRGAAELASARPDR
jgi:hypothetical protein